MLPGTALSPLVLTALLQAPEHRIWCLFLPMLPQAAAVAALPIACANEAFQAKQVFLTALTAGRLSLGLAFLALLPGWAEWSGALLLAAFACYCLVIAAAGGSCQAWFHALLPTRVQGSYLGRRNAISTIAGCLCTLAIATALAHPAALGLRDAAAAGRLVFAAGLAMAVLDLGILARVSRGRPVPPPPVRPLLRRLRDARLWRTATQPVLAGIGGMIAAPIGLLLWYDLGLDALQVGIIGIAAMLGGSLGFWHGGHLADRLEPARLLAAGAAVQALGAALLACVGLLGCRGGLGTGALCVAGIALAFAGAVPAAIAAMAQTKLVFRRVPDGAAGDFACIGTMASLLGLMVTASSGLLAVWLQRHAAAMPCDVPPALPQLVLAMLAALIGWTQLRRHKTPTCT